MKWQHLLSLPLVCGGSGRLGGAPIAVLGVVVVGVVAGGASLGLVLRAVSASTSPGATAAAAATLLIVLAPCAAVAVAPEMPSRRAALRGLVSTAASAAVATLVAVWTTGSGISPWASAAVVGAVSALAVAVARAFRGRGVSASAAAFAGAAVPFVLAATVFVADPFVEWRRTGPGASGRAQLVLALNPVASALSSLADDSGSGVDWQRSRWLYDGPPGDVAGLSVIGAYYPSRPSSPWTWSLFAGIAASVLVLIPASGRYDRTVEDPGSAP